MPKEALLSMLMAATYLSLPELSEPSASNLTWCVLPMYHAQEENIVVRVSAVQGYMRLAGLGGLTVRQYIGEESEERPTGGRIGGLNPDGSTTGFMAISRTRAKRLNSDIEKKKSRCRTAGQKEQSALTVLV